MRRDKPLLVGWNQSPYTRRVAMADRCHAKSEFQRARLEDVAGAPSKAEPHLSEPPRQAAT